jgi:transposase
LSVPLATSTSKEVIVDDCAAGSDVALDALLELLRSACGEEPRLRVPQRHELTDEEWELIAPLLPEPKSGLGKPGRPSRKNRQMLDAILWLLRTGAPWRDLPRARFGPWTTVYTRFSSWRREGALERLVEGLLGVLNDADEIDWELWCVDGSVVRAARCAWGYPEEGGPPHEPADHAIGMSRGGNGTKFHLLTDGKGTPLAVRVTAGQAHESKSFEEVIDAVHIPQPGPGRPRQRPKALAGDKGYSFKRIRDWLRKRSIERVIAQRSDQEGRRGGHNKFDKKKYKRRHVVEQCVGWLKECRRVLTRFEKLAVNYVAMLQLAFVLRYLRILV